MKCYQCDTRNESNGEAQQNHIETVPFEIHTETRRLFSFNLTQRWRRRAIFYEYIKQKCQIRFIRIKSTLTLHKVPKNISNDNVRLSKSRAIIFAAFNFPTATSASDKKPSEMSTDWAAYLPYILMRLAALFCARKMCE